MGSDDELLSTQAAARLAGRSVNTVNRWVTEGYLSPVVSGEGVTGARFFRRSDVLAELERRGLRPFVEVAS